MDEGRGDERTRDERTRDERTKRIISVRDLDVYKLAFETATEVFEISKKFPREEKYSLTDQVRRSSRSVCANLAEGWRKRRYKAVFINKLSDASQEAAETQTWLEFALRCNYIDRDTFDELDEKYEHIFAMLNTMEQKVDTFCKARPLSSILSSFILSSFILLSSIVQAEASITLRVTAVNPSSETQTVPVKVFLPLEVKPEDIIYKEDLEVAYDAQLGAYYVFKEYEIKPLEVLEKEIEIKDVWVIQEIEMESLRQDSKRLRASSEKTPVSQNISLICNAIDRKLDEVSKMQGIPAVSPTQHISDYRYCLELLKVIKSELVQANSLLAQVAVRPSLGATIWKIILFIIIFLGVLGLTFYIIWQRQARLIKEITPAEPKEELIPPGKGEEDKPKEKQV